MSDTGHSATPPRAALYGRISRADAKERKVSDQLAECQTYANRCGYVVVSEFAEAPGTPASDPEKVARPEFAAMLAAVERGEVDVIVATHLYRFQRNDTDALLLRSILSKAGAFWDTVDGGVQRFESPEDKLLATMRGALGSFDNDVRVAAVRRGNRAKRDRGEAVGGGTRPFGYEMDRKTVIPAERDVFLAAVDAVLSNPNPDRGAYRAQRVVNAAGIPTTLGTHPWPITTVERMLRNPRYAGLVVIDGEISDTVRGQWEPLIDVETHRAIVARLSPASKGDGHAHAPKYLLTGLAKCGVCGSVMSSATTGFDSAGERIRVLSCVNRRKQFKHGVRHPAIRVNVIDARVREAVVACLVIDRDGGAHDIDAEVSAKVSKLMAEQMALSAKQARLTDLAMELENPGPVNAKMKVNDARISAIRAEITALTANSVSAQMLAELRARLVPTVNTSGQVAGLMRLETWDNLRADLERNFDAASLEDQRALVRGLVDVVVHNGRTADRVQVRSLSHPEVDLFDEEVVYPLAPADYVTDEHREELVRVRRLMREDLDRRKGL